MSMTEEVRPCSNMNTIAQLDTLHVGNVGLQSTWDDDSMLKSVGVVIHHGKCVCKEVTADPCPHAYIHKLQMLLQKRLIWPL